MNLIDAIKSGRPICRPSWRKDPCRWHWICSKHMLESLGRGDMRPFSEEDFLADDWEVKENDAIEEVQARLSRILREYGTQPNVLEVEWNLYSRCKEQLGWRGLHSIKINGSLIIPRDL